MRIIVLIIVALIACRLIVWTGPIHAGLGAVQHQGSIGGIIVGLILCVPVFGFIVLLRAFSRWQRSFHHRMRTEGAFGNRRR
jgi:uncharacterized membrane protein